MKSIATLTLNPTIDVTYEVDRLIHTEKVRTLGETHSPGGGGINVARVFVRLGGNARCYYLSGGATGVALDGLIDLHQLVRHNIPISGQTRVATVVLERETGKEYRLVPPGPQVTEADCRACLEALSDVSCDMLVASGSLPPGMPTGFLIDVSSLMRSRGIDFVLDTSGEALSETLRHGHMLLVKPSLSEFEYVCGRQFKNVAEISEAASEIVRRGNAQLLAVTMGREGAVLAHHDGTLFLPGLDVEARSAVGAGDSFLAAMVHALAREWDAIEAFRYGIAAGSAAVLTSGTSLAHREDIERLFSAAER